MTESNVNVEKPASAKSVFHTSEGTYGVIVAEQKEILMAKLSQLARSVEEKIQLNSQDRLEWTTDIFGKMPDQQIKMEKQKYLGSLFPDNYSGREVGLTYRDRIFRLNPQEVEVLQDILAKLKIEQVRTWDPEWKKVEGSFVDAVLGEIILKRDLNYGDTHARIKVRRYLDESKYYYVDNIKIFPDKDAVFFKDGWQDSIDKAAEKIASNLSDECKNRDYPLVVKS